jgi:hypothetical protein
MYAQQKAALINAFDKMTAQERSFYVELFQETVAGRTTKPQLTLVTSGGDSSTGAPSTLRRNVG